MTDIWITQEAFETIRKRGKYSGVIFESRGYLITSSGTLTVIAKKKVSDKIYPISIPFYRFGYVSIASQDTKLFEESDPSPLVLNN